MTLLELSELQPIPSPPSDSHLKNWRIEVQVLKGDWEDAIDTQLVVILRREEALSKNVRSGVEDFRKVDPVLEVRVRFPRKI